MKRQEMMEMIYNILKEKLELPTISSFHEDTRLNEDLYLDSVMILELVLHLELDFGIKVPDELLVPKDFRTVGTLIDFIQRQQCKAFGGVK
ncbi:acyl carrier protein [Bacillus sp. UMB0899]|nr:acyl carrier protein [Bacillus sp. UMB0899]